MKNLLLVFLLVSIISCQNNNKDKEILIRYTDALDGFNNELINHFPDGVNELRNFYSIPPEGAYAQGFSTLRLTLFNSTEEINRILSNMRKEGALNASSIANSIFVINDSLVSNECKNCMPIPDFSNLKNVLKISLEDFNNDFQTYILEAKSGTFLDEKYLVNHSNFPKEWKHGFSRGILISEKYQLVTYWLDIW